MLDQICGLREIFEAGAVDVLGNGAFGEFQVPGDILAGIFADQAEQNLNPACVARLINGTEENGAEKIQSRCVRPGDPQGKMAAVPFEVFEPLTCQVKGGPVHAERLLAVELRIKRGERQGKADLMRPECERCLQEVVEEARAFAVDGLKLITERYGPRGRAIALLAQVAENVLQLPLRLRPFDDLA